MSGKLVAVLLFIMGNMFFINGIKAQKKVLVSGTVTDAGTGKPVVYATISFDELTIGTSSGEKGEFMIRSVPAGTYTLTVRYIGYEEYSAPVTLTEDVHLDIRLKQQSLGLQEVVVTAGNPAGEVTSSEIKSDAISHIQASSLLDVMQLVPGNLLANPDLSNVQKISIREVDSDANSTLGTSIIVDNIPMSNDGNMQESIESSGFHSSAGSGIDLRSISVENIESVTVDVGIPSAEHGNLTSGAVHIKTKTGGSPYHVKLKADPYTKQAYLGKGYLLRKELGVVNLDAGYTHSYRYLTTQTDSYERADVTTKYSNTFFRGTSPLNVDFKMNLISTLDGEKQDPDMLSEEKQYSRERNFSTKISAGWSLNKSFITSLTFDAGYSRTWQKGFEKVLETTSNGPTYFPTATTSGEYEIEYCPSSYYSEVTYDGRPYDIYLKLKAKLHKKTGPVTNTVLFGTEWHTTGNNGKGLIFDPSKPPSGGETRPRSFRDIPDLNQFSLFLEDKITYNIGTTALNVTAGLRMDNIQPNGLFSTDGSIGLDPRINIRYNILNKGNNKLFKDLSLRLGYGQTTKAPTLLHLYPDKAYNDVVGFNYYPDLIVVTTSVVEDTRNYDLKPVTGNKYETGIDFKIGKIQGRLTAFYEKQKGGFTKSKIYYPVHYRDYETIDDGLSPYYIEGEGVYYNDPESGNAVAVGYEDDVKFEYYERYCNAKVLIKRGLEYSVDFGKTDAIRTSFNVSGAWFQTESYTTDAPYWDQVEYTVYEGNTGEQKSYAVKFPDHFGYGTIKERLNTNLGIITHIPELKMLVSLNTQILWFERDWRRIYSGNKLYTLSELRDYLGIPDLFSSDGEDDYYYYVPVSYKEYDNVEHLFATSDFESSLFQQSIEKTARYRFAKQTKPPLFLCNIKLSKDIGKRFKLSFYANNIFNIRPWYLDKREGTYERRNEKPYFGADISMQF